MSPNSSKAAEAGFQAKGENTFREIARQPELWPITNEGIRSALDNVWRVSNRLAWFRNAG